MYKYSFTSQPMCGSSKLWPLLIII